MGSLCLFAESTHPLNIPRCFVDNLTVTAALKKSWLLKSHSMMLENNSHHEEHDGKSYVNLQIDYRKTFESAKRTKVSEKRQAVCCKARCAFHFASESFQIENWFGNSDENLRNCLMSAKVFISFNQRKGVFLFFCLHVRSCK